MPPYALLWAWPFPIPISYARRPWRKRKKKEKEKKRKRKKKKQNDLCTLRRKRISGRLFSINPRRYDSNQMLRLWSNSKSWNIDITWQWDFGALEIVYDIGYLLTGGIVVHTPDVPLSSDKIWPDSTGNRTYQVHVVFMHLSQLHMYM